MYVVNSKAICFEMKRIVVSFVRENAEGTKIKNVLFNIYVKTKCLPLLQVGYHAKLEEFLGALPTIPSNYA